MFTPLFASIKRHLLLPTLCCLLPSIFFTGCGGGGGGALSAGSGSTAASATSYALRPIVSANVGPSGATVSGGGVTFSARMPATQTITISERVYPGGPPASVYGRVVDIQPDGTQFPSGASLCLSYDGYPGDVSRLAIFTGDNLTQKIASSVVSSNKTLCSTLAHASPYSIGRVIDLTVPSWTLFAMMDKTKFPGILKTSTETDPTRGSLMVYEILVDCFDACAEGGRRRFKFATGGDHDGDLLIDEREASYPMWRDTRQLFWSRLRNSSGAVEGGISYWLAAQFIKYYTGVDTWTSTIDQPVNRVTRFFYFHDNSLSPDYFVDLMRDETSSPGIITMNTRDSYGHDWTYTIDRATAAITRVSRFSGGPAPVTATTDAAAYTGLSTEVLSYLFFLVGLDDTPDGSWGDAHDDDVRMSPNQELFAVNVMNLVRGYGWLNTSAVEAYYRDRLDCLSPADCRSANGRIPSAFRSTESR